MILLAGVVPAMNFALDDWKLQLPVDAEGGLRGRYEEVVDLADYESPYFRTGPDGAMVLTAPVEGVTTKGSRYARTELREMDGGRPVAWDLATGGALSVAMKVDELPRLIEDGSPARIVIGQIHGGDGQLVRLYYTEGTVYWVAGRNEAQPSDVLQALRDPQGHRPEIALGEPFVYTFTVTQDRLTVAVVADGRTYFTTTPVDAAWRDNGFYFKAGVYLGTDETTSEGVGRVSIYGLGLSHDGHAPALEFPGAAPAPDLRVAGTEPRPLTAPEADDRDIPAAVSASPASGAAAVAWSGPLVPDGKGPAVHHGPRAAALAGSWLDHGRPGALAAAAALLVALTMAGARRLDWLGHGPQMGGDALHRWSRHGGVSVAQARRILARVSEGTPPPARPRRGWDPKGSAKPLRPGRG